MRKISKSLMIAAGGALLLWAPEKSVKSSDHALFEGRVIDYVPRADNRAPHGVPYGVFWGGPHRPRSGQAALLLRRQPNEILNAYSGSAPDSIDRMNTMFHPNSTPR